MNEMQEQIHDCFVSVKGKTPSVTEIALIADQLPFQISKLAEMWGWDDTEVRDKAYVWIQDNLK
jgi:hypothetical protein